LYTLWGLVWIYAILFHASLSLVTVNQAVRALRKHVRKTQQIFATDLGISISSLNNYERKRIPEPRQLLAFERAAVGAGRRDLAKVFGARSMKPSGSGGPSRGTNRGSGFVAVDEVPAQRRI
jgi:hypothetical protein